MFARLPAGRRPGQRAHAVQARRSLLRAGRVLLCLLLGLAALSAASGGAQGQVPIIDNRVQDTSLAFGTFMPPPGCGSPQPLVFAGTLISTKAHNDASGSRTS
jgi:hypothetical protein